MDLQHGFWIGYLIIRSFFLYLKAVRREIVLFCCPDSGCIHVQMTICGHRPLSWDAVKI